MDDEEVDEWYDDHPAEVTAFIGAYQWVMETRSMTEAEVKEKMKKVVGLEGDELESVATRMKLFMDDNAKFLRRQLRMRARDQVWRHCALKRYSIRER